MTRKRRPFHAGPRTLKQDNPRPTQHCVDCKAVLRRRPKHANDPCPHCGGGTKRVKPLDPNWTPPEPVPDYERHAIRIAGETAEWTEQRIAEVLRAQRRMVRDGEV